MPLHSNSGNKTTSMQWMTKCKIIKMDYGNDACDIIELDENEDDTCIVHKNVPIFYHCWPSMNTRSNGALEGSSSAFEMGDKVIMQSEFDLSKNFVHWAIVGFLDKKKPCGDKLFFIIIDDRLMWDPYDSNPAHLTKTIKNVGTKPTGGFTIMTDVAVIVSISMNGGLLTVQSSEDKNEHIAELPTKFTMSDSLSYEPGYGDSQWNAVYQLFNHNVLKGSYRAWNPLEGMGYCLTARRGYKLNSDNEIVTCYYSIKTEFMTPLTCYCYIGLLPTYRTKVRQSIQYKENPFDTKYITGALIGDDYESPPAMILKDGYLYWYFHIIALFDEGKAIYRKVHQNMILSAHTSRWLTVHGHYKTTYYGIDGNTLQACYAWEERGGSYSHGGYVGHVVWTEELHIGSEVLTLTRNEKKAVCEGWFYPTYVFPYMGSGGDCYGGMVEITGVDQVCEGSVSGNGDVPLSYTSTCGGTVIHDNNHASVDGSNNFQVYTFDSYQGEEWYFLIYSYDETSLSYTWVVNHYVNTYNFKRHFYMKYKYPGGAGATRIGGWETTLTNSTPNGTIILYPSVQINRGMILYTYVTANAATSVFQDRVVGIINGTNKTFPLGINTYNSPTIFGVDADLWQQKMAVGIST